MATMFIHIMTQKIPYSDIISSIRQHHYHLNIISSSRSAHTTSNSEMEKQNNQH